MRNIIDDYFNYTRTERNGIYILLIIIAILIASNLYYNQVSPEVELHDYSRLETKLAEIDSIQNVKQKEYENRKGKKSKFTINQSFATSEKNYSSNQSKKKKSLPAALSLDAQFNPNTITKEELIAIGIPSRVANTWTNFIAKGGRFDSGEDIAKIYGLSSTHQDQLKPFISIPQKETKIDSVSTIIQKDSFAIKAKIKYPKVALNIDINQTIPEELQLIYGIGPALSKRILKYRDKLGGFVDSTQLAEVWGLQDSTLTQLYENTIIQGDVKKININTSSLDELKEHPYIKYNQAKVIVRYRDNHGHYENWENVLKVRVIKADSKLKAYLNY